NLTAVGGNDAFLLKLGFNGNFLFAAQAGSSAAESVNGVATDKSGNVYATGTFAGSIDFDPSSAGITRLVGSSTGSAFVWKLSNSAAFGYARQLGGTVGAS